jgi:hypothetical protein
LPCCDLVSEPFGVFDAATETLALKHTDLALDHVEPTGVLRGVVEFEAVQDASGLGGAKASYSAPGLWIAKLSCTTRMQAAWAERPV